MMTQQLAFSVLSAPVAAIDRRSLSQAWYSALHLARTRPVHDPRPVPIVSHDESSRRLRVDGPRSSHARSSSTHVTLAQAKRESTRVAAGIERRTQRSALARKIEYLFLHPARRVERATFTLAGTGARVHVTLQTTRGGLRLVAVCPHRVRERVARALDEARYALAARGIGITAHVAEPV